MMLLRPLLLLLFLLFVKWSGAVIVWRDCERQQLRTSTHVYGFIYRASHKMIHWFIEPIDFWIVIQPQNFDRYDELRVDAIGMHRNINGQMLGILDDKTDLIQAKNMLKCARPEMNRNRTHLKAQRSRTIEAKNMKRNEVTNK